MRGEHPRHVKLDERSSYARGANGLRPQGSSSPLSGRYRGGERKMTGMSSAVRLEAVGK
jgi:hypothetical protein